MATIAVLIWVHQRLCFQLWTCSKCENLDGTFCDEPHPAYGQWSIGI